MSLKFKVFVTKPFEDVLVKVVKHPWDVEASRLAFKKFRNKYIKELELFKERFTEVQKEAQEELESLSEEEKKVKEEEVNKKFMEKVNELCECDSDLKPLDYNIVKDCILNQLEWDVFEFVLTNIPEE